MTYIEIKGAKTHNLKDIDVNIPKNKLVAFTGVSGSGKSSLVFDTIYTEAQRQLIDTFSTFARRRLPKLSRPPVDEIRNISPCIVIDQKRMGKNSRSTVGTATEIYTYLRMLFSRCGKPFAGWSHVYSFNHPEGMCPTCKGLGKKITVNIDNLLDLSKSIEEGAILHPLYEPGKWYWRELMSLSIIPVDKPLGNFTEVELSILLWAEDHPFEYEYRGKIYKKKFTGVATKLEKMHVDKNEDQLPNNRLAIFEKLFVTQTCPDCKGARLNSTSLSVQLADGSTIADLIDLELYDLDNTLSKLPQHENYIHMKDVVSTIVDKIRIVLKNLIDIGVGYLSLNRSVATLSGGESQRVKMARQLNCDLVDLLYIMDEPSIGLHPKDIDNLIKLLYRLRDQGNTVLVVEHDTSIINASDWIVDVGPKAGKDGGNILFSGTTNTIQTVKTPTSIALHESNGNHSIKRREWKDAFHIRDARKNNLKGVSTYIPKEILTCITGVAGSGKSSLIEEFVEQYKKEVNKNIILIDQRPVSKHSRSNSATYVGIFDSIRKMFAKENNVDPSNFSFNSNGACPKCKGQGFVEMELSFIDDVKIICSSCEGKRYKEEILAMKLANKSIFDVLNLTIKEAIEFFISIQDFDKNKANKIIKGLKLLDDVGLNYLQLGQSLSTLSGGEAQRLKLASELKKSGNVYIMDEPTTGLHPADVQNLLRIINDLVDAGNTVVVIEHNLDVACSSDWIIDVGPEGGKKGGNIVAEGTPEQIAQNHESITAPYLSSLLL